MSSYIRQDSRGKVYEFNGDTETLSGWQQHGTGDAHADGFSLVAHRDLARSEGIAFGRGQSENPDRAEAYLYFDAQDGTPADINGKYELVVLNEAYEVLATVDRGRLEEVRSGDPKQLGGTDKRGEYGVPFPYQALRGGKGEVIGDAYAIGIRIETDSGTSTFNVSNSDLLAEGYSGRVQN